LPSDLSLGFFITVSDHKKTVPVIIFGFLEHFPLSGTHLNILPVTSASQQPVRQVLWETEAERPYARRHIAGQGRPSVRMRPLAAQSLLAATLPLYSLGEDRCMAGVPCAWQPPGALLCSAERDAAKSLPGNLTVFH
jgi:hypothetical protein